MKTRPLLVMLAVAWALSNAPAAQETNLAAAEPKPVAQANSPAYMPDIRTNPTNWMSRHEGFVAQAKEGNIDLLFMGDSITDFWRNRGSNVWNQYYAPKHAADFGIGGDRTQHVLWRMENG